MLKEPDPMMSVNEHEVTLKILELLKEYDMNVFVAKMILDNVKAKLDIYSYLK